MATPTRAPEGSAPVPPASTTPADPPATADAALAALSASLLASGDPAWHVDAVERVTAALRPLLRPGADLYPGVAFLRSTAYGREADGLAETLDQITGLGHSLGFLDTMPGENADPSELTDADCVLGTDLWLGRETAEAYHAAAVSLLGSEGAARVGIASGDGMPSPYYARPRVELVDSAHVGAASLATVRALGRAWERATVPGGSVAYVCRLTEEPFCLAATTPVPCLVFDVGSSSASPLDRFEAWPVHPSLVEAGPAHVLWAFWHWVGGQVREISAIQIGLGDALHAFAGKGPENLTTEAEGGARSWPALAFRTWRRAEGRPFGGCTVPVSTFRAPDGGPAYTRKTR